MKILLAIFASMTVLAASAQSHLPVTTNPNRAQPLPYGYGLYYPGFVTPLAFSPTFVPIDFSNRHLQLRTFSSIEAGALFFKGGGASYVSAPVGVVLARPLNNNLAAFSSLSVAPTVFSMNQLFAYPTSGPYNLNLNTRLSGGLIYTNDARTFSISGSFSVEKGSYPIYAPPTSHPKSAY